MSGGYRNGAGDLAPKLILPQRLQAEMRLRLANLEEAPHLVELEVCRREAMAVVRGLEVSASLESARIERLYILIEDVATARALQLENGG